MRINRRGAGVADRSALREEARRELARRELARRRLIEFACYSYPQYRPGRAHLLLASYLEQVERFVVSGGREGIGRLMVFEPPRHGKSELVSVRFPAWFLGRNPDLPVIEASCTADLATSFARQVRNIVRDVPFQNVFGNRSGLAPEQQVMLSEDSQAAEAWGIAGHRGGLKAAGVGGAIIGRGAKLAIIDDPFRDRRDAESKPVRDAVDDWYRSTLYTRLEDGGAIVLMHQRWHADDLAGRLLRRMAENPAADRWTVLCLPAVAEEWARTDGVDVAAMRQGWWRGPDPLGRAPGEPLWPEKYPAEALAAIRETIGGYEWDALYQQRPRRLEGALIRAYEIGVVTDETPPDGQREARYWDLAVSGRDSADYVCGARVRYNPATGRYRIVDVVRLRGPWADARAEMVRVMLSDPPQVMQGIEVAGQQAGYYQELQRDPELQTRVIVPVNPREVGNKTVRAQVWASRIGDGLIEMVEAGWNDAFVAECLAFPLGEHDDQVDAVSGAVQMLGQFVIAGDVMV